jgi:hypothetical protein
MTTRRWTIVLGLMAFTLVVVVLALRPWTSNHDLAAPAGVKPQTVSFQCGSVWGSSRVRGPTTTRYPVIGKPCGGRGQQRVLAGIDVAIGLIGMAVVVRWPATT